MTVYLRVCIFLFILEDAIDSDDVYQNIFSLFWKMPQTVTMYVRFFFLFILEDADEQLAIDSNNVGWNMYFSVLSQKMLIKSTAMTV